MGLVITFSNFILIAYTYLGLSLVILFPQDLRQITGFVGKIRFLVYGVSIDFQQDLLEFVATA